MTFVFIVDKVADTRVPLFVPDPNDSLNTMDSGKWVQEITLSRVPDAVRGGVGTLVLQLTEEDQIGQFIPGQTLHVELGP